MFQLSLIQPCESILVLRRANDHEAAAFYLVEQTLRRARPQISSRGLQSITMESGRIERGSFGRLRFRFDGTDSDFEPENPIESRPISDEEATVWNGLQKMMDTTKPVLDPEGNLLSMRIGPRVLRRLPLGSVVTFVPDGIPPFTGSFSLTRQKTRRERELARPTEAELLAAIDEFLRELEAFADSDPRLMAPWNPGSAPNRAGNRGVAPFTRTHRHSRGKWHKCPICHTPVVKDRFNPRIPTGSLRPGAGTIRDLKGGYMSRLRETYLLEETTSLLEPSESK